MKLGIYSIYDAQIKAFMRPMYFLTDGQAIRSFGDEVNRKDTEINKHAKDYSLFRLGEFDDGGAKFELETAPKRLIGAVELLEKGD